MSHAKQILEAGMNYGAPCTEGDYVDYPEAWTPPTPEPPPPIVAVVDEGPKGRVRITNKFNLPQPLVEAVSNNKYSPGKSDYTTTQIAGTPARQLMLKKKHWNELSEDVTDLIYSLSGQSKHVVLERAAEFCEQYKFMAEQRFYITREGKTIGGQIDLYDVENRTLYDWKETGVYVSYHDLKPDWIAQGNINKLLLEEAGYPVEKIVNIVLYRDWKKSEVGRTDKYPPHQVAQFDIPVWTKEETESFITRRIADFESAKKTLPLCSDEERWKSPDLYAMTKKGNKRATKLFDTQKEADSHIEIFNMKGYEVVFRPGINKRCESYCVAAPFCKQFQQLKEKDDAINGDSKAA
jgi:hypothetical protein